MSGLPNKKPKRCWDFDMTYSGMQPLEGYRGLAIGLKVEGKSVIVVAEEQPTLDKVLGSLSVGSSKPRPGKKALVVVGKLEENPVKGTP